jgi:hypothetical protein
MVERMFDLVDHLTELRSYSTEWLRARDDELETGMRSMRVEQLAVRRVLDERGDSDLAEDALRGRHNESPRTARRTLAMARALESLPAIAAAAHSGELSPDQLQPLVQIATPSDDAEWARRAPNYSPFELERLARQQRGVTAAEAAARRDARELKWWWRRDTGMLAVRGEIPDVEGALVAKVFERMTDRMRPAKGGAWDTLAHRGADALVDLCKGFADANPGPLRSHITFHVPPDGPAEVDGIPIADSTLTALMADATTANVTVEDGRLFGARTETESVPSETSRFVRARDLHCRVGTCEETRGLDEHHLIPRCEGGSHDPQNVVLAGRPCGHHRMLVPNGPWRLEGDPSTPDGLTLTRVDQPIRAGPAP